MAKRIDLTGKKFGRVTVIDYSHTQNKRAYWNAVCDCGNIKIIQGRHLRNGETKSCGCLYKESNTKHGMWRISEYTAWDNMKQRCYNKNNPIYIYYGGRGIKVCDRWMKFENFYKDMGEKPKGLTLERSDNEKGYFPKNCCWATYSQQAQNKRKYQTKHLMKGRT